MKYLLKFLVHGTVFTFRVMILLLTTLVGVFAALFSGAQHEEVDPDDIGGSAFGFTNDLSATNNWRDPRDTEKNNWIN